MVFWIDCYGVSFYLPTQVQEVPCTRLLRLPVQKEYCNNTFNTSTNQHKYSYHR